MHDVNAIQTFEDDTYRESPAASSGSGDSAVRAMLLPNEKVHVQRCRAPREWTELLLGSRDVVTIPVCGSSTSAAAGVHAPRLVFPGAFNPLHHGHVRMAQIAAERKGEPVWLEISIANVDKPPLDFLTTRERIEQLSSYNVCLTRAATFVEKAKLFPGATFIVGADTLARIADERYYHGRAEERDAAVSNLAQAGVRFLVFGRTLDGHFTTLADLFLPGTLAGLCEAVPESEFHEDIASTELRSTGG